MPEELVNHVLWWKAYDKLMHVIFTMSKCQNYQILSLNRSHELQHVGYNNEIHLKNQKFYIFWKLIKGLKIMNFYSLMPEDIFLQFFFQKYHQTHNIPIEGYLKKMFTTPRPLTAIVAVGFGWARPGTKRLYSRWKFLGRAGPGQRLDLVRPGRAVGRLWWTRVWPRA